MLTLLLILLTVGVTLIVLLWVGTLFLQGYFYTEPTTAIHWQAPAAGASLTLFLLLWCLLIANSSTATTQDIPYDTLTRFSPQVEMFTEPVRELWVVPKGATKEVRYTLYRDPQRNLDIYKRAETLSNEPLSDPSRFEALIVKGKEGEKIRFTPAKASEGGYARFVSDSGWEMNWYDRPSGRPLKFLWGRFLLTLFLNFFHLGLWFVCLWLLLRFQWAHALGLAIVLWLVMTLAFLPMLLTQAAQVAQDRRMSGDAAPKARAPVRTLGSFCHAEARMCMMSPSWTT